MIQYVFWEKRLIGSKSQHQAKNVNMRIDCTYSLYYLEQVLSIVCFGRENEHNDPILVNDQNLSIFLVDPVVSG
jgi:hypothetical protein